MNYNFSKYFGDGHWISKDGTIEILLSDVEHSDIACSLVKRYYKKIKENMSQSECVDFLLNNGWITNRNGNFFCNKLDNTTKDTIFIFAKKNKYKKITVETPHSIKVFEEPPERLYEHNVLHEQQNKFNLQQKFNEYNKLFFDGKIKIPVSLSWSSSMRRKLGVVKYNRGPNGLQNVQIILSSFFDMDEQMFKDTLVHEMIHCFLLQKGIYVAHGEEFLRKADEINKKFGTNIDVVNEEPEIKINKNVTNKIENIILLKRKNGELIIAVLANKVLQSIILIDWQKFANDIGNVENIILCKVSADKVWRFKKSISGKIKFQSLNQDYMKEIEQSAQPIQQLFP